MKRTFWSVFAICVLICAGCGAPPEGDGSSETDAIHGESFDTGEDGTVADEDFDAGETETLGVGDEPAGDQEADTK